MSVEQATISEELISQLETLRQSSDLLPSPRQLFAVGRLMFRITKFGETIDDLLPAYQHLVDSIPEAHWKVVSRILRTAADRVVTLEDSLGASHSLQGLLTNAPQLCHLFYSTEWIATLATLYDRFILQDAIKTEKEIMLSALSSLILDGLLLKPRASTEEELLEAIQAMDEHSVDCLGDLQEWQERQEPFRRTLKQQVHKISSEDQQRDYILSMLESSRQKQTSPPAIMAESQSRQGKHPAAVARKPVAIVDELERRIQQIKLILPDFGEGFIESALSLHQGDVETTMATLLNDPSTYPAGLRALDTKLPRRRKQRADEEAKEAAEARKLVKERVAVEQMQEEARYKALMYIQEQEQLEQPVVRDEYDDDYDDQYDEIDVKLGGADDGMYDFEQVKLYNQLVRTEEAEDSFWEENRNVNRMPQGKSKNSEEETGDTAKQYRGHDKIRGGRVVGPDGKFIRKPGGQRGKKSGNNTNKNNNNGGAPASQTANGNAKGGQPAAAGQSQIKGKPKTKPKSQNRVNRQRDKKQKAQGTFGDQS